MESQARGGIRWKRFGVVMVPTVAATAAIGVALAQGALAASFSVSGQQFKVSTAKLEGEGFAQWGELVHPAGQDEQPVAVSAFKTATIHNLCQSVVVPTPIGNVTVKLNAGGNPKKPVKAENLFIDLTQLETDAVFKEIDIGVNAATVTKGPKPSDPALYGAFAQQAKSATLTDVKQTAWATSAGTFRLNGLKMNLYKGKNECF